LEHPDHEAVPSYHGHSDEGPNAKSQYQEGNQFRTLAAGLVFARDKWIGFSGHVWLRYDGPNLIMLSLLLDRNGDRRP
jgi:hypothetical protein